MACLRDGKILNMFIGAKAVLALRAREPGGGVPGSHWGRGEWLMIVGQCFKILLANL